MSPAEASADAPMAAPPEGASGRPARPSCGRGEPCEGCVDDALRAVDATREGLAAEEAARRLARDGPNALPEPRARGLARAMLAQFRSPLVAVLAAAIALSLAIGESADALFVAAVLAVNATIGGVQEWRADRSARALRAMLHMRATVVRDGRAADIDARAVVVGDLVLVESGDRVPADARLLADESLEVDESLLTGESTAVAKDAAWTPAAHRAPLAEQANMLHAGTTVARGRARAVVVATGARAALGRLAGDVERARRGTPPLVLRLERFTRAVGLATLVAAALVGLVGWLVRGHPPAQMAIFAVALAVSVIPEGLPVAITVALSVASRRMARRGVVVRRLAAVEGLGSCTIVLSDKTGTLTCNELTVRDVRLASGSRLEAGGAGFAPGGTVEPPRASLDARDRDDLDRLVDIAVLANEAALERIDGAWRWRGDPTEVALLAFARKLGASRGDRLAACPERSRTGFEAERRYSSAVHEIGGAPRLLAKGAPERIAAMCAPDAAPDLEAARAMAASGLRVLAFADGPVGRRAEAAAESGSGTTTGTTADTPPVGLRCVGLVGMIDPLRTDAADAVRRATGAGVEVAIVTGDHPATALAIARELGLVAPGPSASPPDDAMAVVTGAHLAALDDDGLDALLETRFARGGARVFARTDPAQKLRLVEAARRAGHLVAVTGDGANDAPALKAANIGVAMGRSGTDAAREAADLVVADDRLATIVDGIEQGRVAYANIRKVVHLLVSTNGAEVVLVVGAVALGLPLPLLPTQLLWLNLATEGLQDVALAFEPPEGDELRRPPRPPRESIFDRLMVERLVVGSVVMGGVSLAFFGWLVGRGIPEEEARNQLLLLMVLFENVQAGNSRSETRSAFASWPWRNPALLAAVALGFALHLVAMHWAPLGTVLGTAPVAAPDFVRCAALSLLVLAAVEWHKWRWRRRRESGVADLRSARRTDSA